MNTKEEMNAELNAIRDEELKPVNGGFGRLGAGLPIDSEDPRCPDDECPLLLIHFEKGFDQFQCRCCRRQFKHLWEGDVWMDF